MLDASEAVRVKSSLEALPTVVLPLKVTLPAQVSAEIEKSFEPSVREFIMSVKLVLTWVASAVVEFVNVWLTLGLGICIP